MKKILFVCSGNTCRSPMAEGIFNHICKEENLPFVSESAGVCTLTGLPVSEHSVSALADIGIDIKGMKATAITDVNLDDFYLIAVMTSDHRDNLHYYDVPRDKIYVLNEDKGGIFDPYGGSQPLYNICRDEITEEVKILIERLRSEV